MEIRVYEKPEIILMSFEIEDIISVSSPVTTDPTGFGLPGGTGDGYYDVNQ